MGVQVLRLGRDQYVKWSNTVDAPVTWVMTREQMVDSLEEERDGTTGQTSELLALVDRTGSSDCHPIARQTQLLRGAEGLRGRVAVEWVHPVTTRL